MMVLCKPEPPHLGAVDKADSDRVVHLVARRIAELRAARGLTQEDVAARLGTATKNYQRIESGQQNLTIRTLARLAAVFEVEPIALWEPPVSPHRRAPGRPRRPS
jgi:transcriptional regulator with XRE-family HTH domain